MPATGSGRAATLTQCSAWSEPGHAPRLRGKCPSAPETIDRRTSRADRPHSAGPAGPQAHPEDQCYLTMKEAFITCWRRPCAWPHPADQPPRPRDRERSRRGAVATGA
jgi:hypothetical protein